MDREREAGAVTVRGLKNAGNTCWLASTVQALASSQALIDYLETFPVSLPLCSTLLDLLKSLQPTHSRQKAASLTEVLDELRLHIPEGVLEDQQENDAVEALDLILDAISEEVHRHADRRRGSHVGSLASIVGMQAQSQDPRPQHPDAGRLSKWRSAVGQPWQGMTTTRLICCACGNESTSQFTAFRTCLLPVVQGAFAPIITEGMSVETCLAESFREEIVDGVHCLKCSLRLTLRSAKAQGICSSPELKVLEELALSSAPLTDSLAVEDLARKAGIEWKLKQASAQRISAINQAPQVLALHMRRGVWSADGSARARYVKLSGHVIFPEILDLKPYTCEGDRFLRWTCQDMLRHQQMENPEAALSNRNRQAAASSSETAGAVSTLPSPEGTFCDSSQDRESRHTIVELSAAVSSCAHGLSALPDDPDTCSRRESGEEMAGEQSMASSAAMPVPHSPKTTDSSGAGDQRSPDCVSQENGLRLEAMHGDHPAKQPSSSRSFEGDEKGSSKEKISMEMSPSMDPSVEANERKCTGGEDIALADDSAQRCLSLFELTAVIVHAGSSATGHYCVYRRAVAPGCSDVWLSVSDERVSQCSLKEVQGSEATLLLYALQR